jgi:hypothetical protein
MIICVTGWFPVYDRNGVPTGKKEFGVSHGIDSFTGRNVIVPAEPPERLGAKWNAQLHEWVLYEDHEV